MFAELEKFRFAELEQFRTACQCQSCRETRARAGELGVSVGELCVCCGKELASNFGLCNNCDESLNLEQNNQDVLSGTS